MVAALRADLAAARHPADGGGEAVLATAEPSPVPVGTPGRWRIRYRAGPLGVAAGGMVYLQVSPFWGWSTPQPAAPERPGYTVVTTDAAGVELLPRTLDQQLLGIEIAGRALAAGEELVIDYGAGPAGALADRYAERESRFWIAVDGDGDGVRKLLAESPAVDVVPGRPARVVVHLPSTARPGERLRLAVAVVDAVGNAGVPFAGEVELASSPPLSGLPARVVFAPEQEGTASVELTAAEPGVYRVAARALGREWGSNPLQVSAGGARILWGDFQNHSGLSDGTGLPEDLLRYARDVAALDVVALTDHDHWGMRFLDASPDFWRGTAEAVGAAHDPGRFVALLGYEWTSWLHGHRHVVFFADPAGVDFGALRSSIDERWDHPEELWAGLRAGDHPSSALTFAHHSAGGPIATDWSIAPDPELEPVTEIVSVHGSSESADAPGLIYRPVQGNFVRDALARGYRLGFVGSSDGHDGHPGLAHLASSSGGVAAILAEDATREAVYRALRARRTYATSGPRILLRATLGGWPMGSAISLGSGESPPVAGIPTGVLVVQVHAVAPLERIDVVRSGDVVLSLPCAGELACDLTLEVPDPAAGEYLYLRVVQEDGHAAWSSPFFFVE